MNLHCKSPGKNLRRSFARFQQHPPPLNCKRATADYFLLSLAGEALPVAFSASFAGGLGGVCLAGAFTSTLAAGGSACALSPGLPFLSLPLLSLGFGGSLIPESLRRILSRSSGVLPLPFSCMANICSTTASNFGPAGIPMRASSSRTIGTPVRSGRHLFRYARILDRAAELRDSASR